jgi:hypothetical protein
MKNKMNFKIIFMTKKWHLFNFWNIYKYIYNKIKIIYKEIKQLIAKNVYLGILNIWNKNINLIWIIKIKTKIKKHYKQRLKKTHPKLKKWWDRIILFWMLILDRINFLFFKLQLAKI